MDSPGSDKARLSHLNPPPPQPPFQGGDQDLRAFHRHSAFPARQLQPGI